MRARLTLVAAFVVMGCAMSAGSTAQTEPVAVNPKEVAVTVICSENSDSVWVKVDPWQVEVKKNQAVEWDFTSASIADTMTITAKDPTKWPYDDAPPYGAKKGKSKAKGSNMNPNAAKGDKYGYDLQVTCKNGGGPKHELVIDPELIIVN